MKIKKFRGRTIAEVAERVKEEWGPDALILQSRRVRAARWLFFRRPAWEIEVTAAHAEGDRSPGVAPSASPSEGEAVSGPVGGFTPPVTPAAAIGVYRAAGTNPPDAEVPPAARVLAATLDPPAIEFPSPAAPAAATGAAATVKSPASSLPAIEADVRQMKDLVACIWQQVRPAGPGMEQAADLPPLYPAELEPIYRDLLSNEVEPSLARYVTDTLLDGASGKGTGLLRQECWAVIERLLGPGRPIELNGKGKVVALVGPTGVGKTTTLAKLAAHFTMGERKQVALVTIDTFRVGAVDQLRTYAEIAGLSCYVANTPEEYTAILGRLADLDLILVDTAGRSHRDEPRMSELARFWSARRPDEIHLVISATARYSDALEIVDRYRGIGFDRIVFTKLDETRHHGLILNAAVVVQRPMSYITMGQQVPEDIALARAGDLAKLII